jgi:hypothetical protein
LHEKTVATVFPVAALCYTYQANAKPRRTHYSAVGVWFRGPLRELLLETVTTRAVRDAGIFDPEAVRTLIGDHMERRANLGYHLWGLLTLFLWLKRWKIETRILPETAARALITS